MISLSRQLLKNGLTNEQFDSPEEAFRLLVQDHTQVRDIEWQIGTVFPPVAARVARDKADHVAVRRGADHDTPGP